MAGQRLNRIEWFSFYKGGNNQSTLLVDIGGGRGHDLEAFKHANPNAEGKLVLQDLPQVIDDIKELHEDIIKVIHDFFTSQPMKGPVPPYFPASKFATLLIINIRRKSLLPPLHLTRLL
jgi:hypothetical protein